MTFLVTGCGKSATMWASALFTRLRYPCLHEQQFTPTRHGPLVEPEASWPAVPYLAELPAGTPVVWLVRNPWHVVRSAYRRQFLAEVRTPHERFVAEQRPWIVEGEDHLARVIRWVATWDEPLANHPHMVLQPDRQTAPQLAAVVGYATGATPGVRHMRRVIAAVGTVHASHRPVLSAEQIDAHPEGWRIRQRAQRWGYR